MSQGYKDNVTRVQGHKATRVQGHNPFGEGVDLRQLMVVVANIQMKTLIIEVEKGSM